MSGLHLPPAEPPSDEVLAIQAELTLARAERHEAARIIALLVVTMQEEGNRPAGAKDPGELAHLAAWGRIEARSAEVRMELWVAEVARLEAVARAHGLSV